MPKLTDETWQAIRDQWTTGASGPSLAAQYGVSRQSIKSRAHRAKVAARPPSRSDAKTAGQPVLDRAQSALKHRGEWGAIQSIQVDVVAALRGIRTEFQGAVQGTARSGKNAGGPRARKTPRRASIRS
jgi:hypothetical protein